MAVEVWTVLAVMVVGVRSQNSYSSPNTAVLSPVQPFSPSSGSSFFNSKFSSGSSSPSFGGSSNSFSGSSSLFGSSSSSYSSPSSFGSSSNSYSSPSNSLSGSTTSFSGSSSPSFSSGSSFGSSSSGSTFGSSSSSSSSFGSSSGSGSSSSSVSGGIDFSQATHTADGRLCVIKEKSVETVSKDPILECKHKEVEKCHYTYLTYFKPAQEETCEENFEKKCQITFKQEAIQERVRKCYRPVEKVCNGQGPEECKTIYESSCTTRYVDQGQGKFVGDTRCEKLPVKICGAGCVTEEGPEECHDKTIDSLVDVPEELCDLYPQKTCRLVTRLVPSLKPKLECTTVPLETCSLKFSQPKRTQKPLRTEWCLEEQPQAQYSPGG